MQQQNDEKISTTKEKLLKVGLELFATYGFDGTSTRMIAEKAGVNLATRSFHFGSKKNFYCEVLNYTAEQIANSFRTIDTVYQMPADPRDLTAEEAWNKICGLLDMHIPVSIDLRMPDRADSNTLKYMRMLYWEQINHPDGQTPITNVLLKKSEEFLAQLLQCYWGGPEKVDYDTCLALSRLINGGIISFAEHAAFLHKPSETEDKKWRESIKRTIRDYILTSIKDYHPQRKPVDQSYTG